ncbi:hypothetical protein NAH03_25025, partial [Stenotrophomonas maltophilia]|nr:hypothetical protein [Stenotrophomonas maltophilia]
DRAISIVENALTLYGAPIYVRHEVVHNRYVVDSLRKRGAIFIEQISEVPDGAILIFSAHGVSQAVRNEAKSRDLTVFDATCPLVTKVHMEVARASGWLKSMVMESPFTSRITPVISLPSIAVKSIISPITVSPVTINSRREKYCIRPGLATPTAPYVSSEKAFFSPSFQL